MKKLFFGFHPLKETYKYIKQETKHAYSKIKIILLFYKKKLHYKIWIVVFTISKQYHAKAQKSKYAFLIFF